MCLAASYSRHLSTIATTVNVRGSAPMQGRQRLKRCRRDIGDQSLLHQSITSIACR